MSKVIAFNKPYEVLCQFTDSIGRKTLKDYIHISGVYAAGRLDYRSEGLLLLTSDGRLINILTDPRSEHSKTYLVQVEGLINDAAIHRLRSQIVLPGLQQKLAYAECIEPPLVAARVKPVRNYHPTSWLRIVLTEGKKHQVRKMTASVGFPTLRLIRIAIGPIQLGELNPGEWRWITPAEVNDITDSGN